MKSAKEIIILEKILSKLENLHASFDYLRIRIASPDRIISWCERTMPNATVGEVLSSETINFRTLEPEVNGLFCEKIFGPINDWKCRCKRYHGFVLDKICEECNVELIESRVRRYRMGFIELACPITHLWYLKSTPNYLVSLLQCFDKDLTVRDIEQIVYIREGVEKFEKEGSKISRFFSIEEKEIPNEIIKFQERQKREWVKLEKRIDPESELEDIEDFFLKSVMDFKRNGSEVIKAMLEDLNLSQEIKKLRAIVDNAILGDIMHEYFPNEEKIRRLRLLESFDSTNTNPSWMVLTVLPVLPPTLRPFTELENGVLMCADVNEMYRSTIYRNNRVADDIFNVFTPDILTINDKKLLQDAVDSLIDNARLPKSKMICLNDKPLKSLTELLEGKQGRFRQTLLGKRVDYSGRSVIIVGPGLRLNECGLPYEMATKLFEPFLIHELLNQKLNSSSGNIKLAKLILKKNKPFVWTLLEMLAREKCILLNRAPTLHRFGIQAFNPVIVLGKAIHLHPLVCTGFNADFDGDQMAVHLPLYESSQLEARTMMRPSYNVLSPSNGEAILKPTQDMVIGCYYLTLMIANKSSILQKWFSNETEALSAFYQKKLDIHTPILVRYSIFNFKAKIAQNKLKILDSTFFLKERSVLIYKTFSSGNNFKKYYFITNIGILIASSENRETYEITDLFLETTPGRLVFSLNFKNLINTK